MEIPRKDPDGCSTNGVNADDFGLCLQAGCHNTDPFTNNNSTSTNFRAGSNAHYYHLSIERNCGPGGTFKPDWRASSETFVTTCIHCHNIHGSTQLSMIRQEFPVVYYKSGVSHPCGSDPTPEDTVLPDSTGTIWDANNTGSFCTWACHGDCGWSDSVYSRTPFSE